MKSGAVKWTVEFHVSPTTPPRGKWMARLHYLTSAFFLERRADLQNLVGGVSSVEVEVSSEG